MRMREDRKTLLIACAAAAILSFSALSMAGSLRQQAQDGCINDGNSNVICGVTDNSFQVFTSGTAVIHRPNATQPVVACIVLQTSGGGTASGGVCGNVTNGNCSGQQACSVTFSAAIWGSNPFSFKYIKFQNVTGSVYTAGYKLNTP